ncbi:MAG: hypothetical protein GF329_19055 [Candidatus Lokiarchaeota archaeon]|nr:hypothetical protein [Candidatus Lokiarchaeota archaeon]
MKKSKKNYPPKKLNFLDKKSTDNFLSLISNISNNRITIFLGSGLSGSVNLPTWKELLKTICNIFLVHWFFEKDKNNEKFFIPPHKMSIAFTDVHEMLLTFEQREITENFLLNNPLLVAQQIKNCIRPLDWKYLIRKSLYLRSQPPSRSDLTESLIKLIKNNSQKVKAIINYNYDDTLESNLKEENIKFKVISENYGMIHPKNLNIYHPHGYIPYQGGGQSENFYLTEGEYSNNDFSVIDNIQLNYLFNSICIFIGLSMIDPHLRNLIRKVSSYSTKIHFAFINKNFNISTYEKMRQALFDKDLYRMKVKVIRYPIIKSDSNPFKRLPQLLDYLNHSIKDKSFIWV